MRKNTKYKGVVIPAVTPLTEDFKLDKAALEKMFFNFHQNNVLPFIIGTTGEAASLSINLKQEYVKEAVKLKTKGTVLYAGIASNCFEESVDLAKYCFDNGVDVVAANLPSYYALSINDIRKYFERLVEKIQGPLIIYNIPSTTHMSIPLDVIDDLSFHPDIVGVKDSERSDERLKESLKLWSNRKDFSHFIGWGARSAEALQNGSDGLIPSTGNLYPKLYDDMYRALEKENAEKAFQLQKLSDQLGDLYQKGRLLGESLWALKVLMQEAGICKSTVMPPLQPLADENCLKKELHRLVKEQGIQL